jgi:hypothetical protein
MRGGLSVTIFRACPVIREIVTKPPYASSIGKILVVSDKEKRKNAIPLPDQIVPQTATTEPETK